MKIIICLISLFFVPAFAYGQWIEEPPGSQSVEEYIAEEKKEALRDLRA